MAATLEILNQIESACPNDTLQFVAVDASNPGASFVIRVHRRKFDALRNPSTDPVVEQSTYTSDTTGTVVSNWTYDGSFALVGNGYRYYPSLQIKGGDYVTSTDLSDIILLSILDSLIYGVTVSLGPVMAIPVYAEVSKDSGIQDTANTFKFTWANWHRGFPPIIFRLDSDEESLCAANTYNIDYKHGSVTFTEAVPNYAEIEASYVFSYFSDSELRQNLALTLNDMNYIPPYTNYGISGYPPYWHSILISGATTRCLEQLMLAPLFRERQLIFSDEDMISTLGTYYDRCKTSFQDALAKKNRWSLVEPFAVSGHDVMAPPRTTAHNFQQWAYLRGRGF